SIRPAPEGVKAVLPHTVEWSHEQVNALIELMAIVDTLKLTLFLLCKLIIGRYAKSKADVALGRVHYVYDLIEEATKTLPLRFSHMVWEQVKQLSALFVKPMEAVGTPPGLQQATPIAAQNVSGTGLGSQNVAGGIGGGAGLQGLQQVPVATQTVTGTGLESQGVAGGIGGGAGCQGKGWGRQSRASGTGGRRLSGGSKGVGVGTGSPNQERTGDLSGSQRDCHEGGDEEEDYVGAVDSHSMKNRSNNTVVKIIEREKQKKSSSGPYNSPRYYIGDKSSAIGWIG
ncbi:hypothetical protein HDV00_000966, partial [Rhizophlyctis rosea]